MSLRSRPIAVAALAVLVLAPACGSESDSSGQEASVTPTPSDPTFSGTPTSGPAPTEGPAAAMNDLAKRLGIDPGDVLVVSAEEVTWSDASIGCPMPGMMYAQVLTPGSRIVLEANGKRYEYHAASGKAPFLCKKPKPPVR